MQERILRDRHAAVGAGGANRTADLAEEPFLVQNTGER